MKDDGATKPNLLFKDAAALARKTPEGQGPSASTMRFAALEESARVAFEEAAACVQSDVEVRLKQIEDTLSRKADSITLSAAMKQMQRTEAGESSGSASVQKDVEVRLKQMEIVLRKDVEIRKKTWR
eukprot:gnl/TRDRNA2_/TRDRNA2_144793_c0_seq1.p2 gnl/TRDRNA2_/TRDRNA2_144793_c0~~gnl/TRDRNA2_/TRDRNA2_144793_c0_seq1.p2  ORF type:complete len:127 (+),score=32.04 gnl/TRDRNA2_/TRDRNA2_144793_c0_seq1:119-499(+)